MTPKVVMTFETTMTPEDLHELLCLAIHEQDQEALNKLTDQISDIDIDIGTGTNT